MPSAWPFAVRAAAIIAILVLSILPAASASRSDAALLSRMAVILSMIDGRMMVVADGRLLAAAPLPDEMNASARRMRQPDCYGYGCRRGFRDYGYYGGYHEPGYPPEIVLAGPDLRLLGISHHTLPVGSRDRKPGAAMDHWRILYERTGGLESNPSSRISTAALLSPLRDIDLTTTASIAPLRVTITRRNERMVTADVQKLLAGLGHDAGPPDGLPGPMTKAAVLSFQQKRGIEPTGSITPGLIEAIYRAAGATRPEAGRIVVDRPGRKLIDQPIVIDEPDRDLGTHVMVLSGNARGVTEWRLLTFSERFGDYASAVFHFGEKTAHGAAVNQALDRIHLPADIRAKLAMTAGPGSVLVISDQSAGEETGHRARRVWR